MPRFLRLFLSHFIFDRSKREAFREGYGRTRDRGTGNRVIIREMDGRETLLPSGGVIPGVLLYFDGNDNEVYLERPFSFRKSTITLAGDGNRVSVGSTPYVLDNVSFCVKRGGRLTIGRSFSSNFGLEITGFDEPGLGVSIGEDCMFGYRVSIRPSDGHALTDGCGRLLNAGRSVEIGDHVWIAEDVLVLKGSRVPDGCVVGAASVVNKSFQTPSCVIAGVPARVVRPGPCRWTRVGPYEYAQARKDRAGK